MFVPKEVPSILGSKTQAANGGMSKDVGQRALPVYVLQYFAAGVAFHYRPRLTAFFSSAPATNFVTFLAGIFRGAPVWGLRPVLALRELTEKVPNPTKVTLLPFFSVDTTPSSAEFRALLAWTLEIFASFAILSINSPLFMAPPRRFERLSYTTNRCALYRTPYAVSSNCSYERTRKCTADAGFRDSILKKA